MNRFIIICQHGPSEYTDGYRLPGSPEEALKVAVESDIAAQIIRLDDDGVWSDLSRELAEKWFADNSSSYFADEMEIPQFITRYVSPRHIAECRDEYHEEARYEREHERSFARVGL